MVTNKRLTDRYTKIRCCTVCGEGRLWILFQNHVTTMYSGVVSSIKEQLSMEYAGVRI